MAKMLRYRTCPSVVMMSLLMLMVYVSLRLLGEAPFEPSRLESEPGRGQRQGSGSGSGSADEWRREIRLTLDEMRKERQRLEELAARLGFERNHTSAAAPVQGRQPCASEGKEGRQPLILEREEARRKVEYTATELWYYVNAKMEELGGAAAAAAKDGQLQGMIRKAQTDLSGYQTMLVNDLRSLRYVGNDEDLRKKESIKLGNLVQRRLRYLQNPKDCNAAKVLRCDLYQTCGFSCQLTQAIHCLVVAYATQRTLVLQGGNWMEGHWLSAFLPVSDTCTDALTGTMARWSDTQAGVSGARVLWLPPTISIHPRPDFMPLAIPEDLAGRLTTFHGNSPVWWLGQMARFLMRPNAAMEKEIEAAADRMKFQRPIVGVHVRRTDKITAREAAFHELKEYMQHVERYYDQEDHRKTSSGGPRRVYLATDDPEVLSEAKRTYPQYLFLNYKSSTSSKITLPQRTWQLDPESLQAIVLDIHFLASTDFIVCTFSSGVSRVAYELMQTKHGDASTYFRSLDDIFYFHGANPSDVRVTEPHDPGDARDQLSLRVGDALHVAGNHWNGFSKARHVSTGREGLYPSYKAANVVVSAKMPTYPEVAAEDEDEDEATEEKRKGEEGVGEGGDRTGPGAEGVRRHR